MMDSQIAPGANYPASTVQASQTSNAYRAALAYSHAGLCAIPFAGKRPTENDIQHTQRKETSLDVSVVCGGVCNSTFTGLSPIVAETYTAGTDSGKGKVER